MTLLELLNGLVAQLADTQAAADALAKQKYDEGFAAGVASMGSDKIYSQVELDAAVAAAVLPLQDQIAALQVQVDGIPQAIADAVAVIKADLLAKYQEQQADESSKESAFEELLK